MSKESLKLLVVMLRAAQTVEDLVKKDMRTYGINPTEFAVLELLYSKGDQPIQKIGEKILLASSSITYVVDKLEEKGFVERIDSSDDRRVKFASLTKKGKVFMAEVFPKHEKRIEEIFSILNDEERDLAIKLLKKIGLQE
ncbi:MAG: MarR family transcriptional regulator [Tissierellia bacterium]|nr:MarR family transcriptional regulator [Tissierellia bacterium]